MPKAAQSAVNGYRKAISLAIFAVSAVGIYFGIGTTWYGEGEMPNSKMPIVVSTEGPRGGGVMFQFWGEIERLNEPLSISAFDVPVGNYHFEFESVGSITPSAEFEVSMNGSEKEIRGYYLGDDYAFAGMYMVNRSGVEFRRFRLSHGFLVLESLAIAGLIAWVAGKVIKWFLPKNDTQIKE